MPIWAIFLSVPLKLNEDVRAATGCSPDRAAELSELRADLRDGLAGLPAAYIVQQMADYRSGARRTAVPERLPAKLMIAVSQAVTPAEVDLMADPPQIIALELGLRFLNDYLRGDSYFKLGPADPPDRAAAWRRWT